MKTKTIILYIFFVSFIGCKSKQKSIYIEKVKDSTVRNIILQSNNELIISNLCDSITGKPIQFTQDIDTGNSNVKVTSKGNTLEILTNNDSIVYVDRVVSNDVFRDVEVVRNIIPFKYWVFLIVSILGNIALFYFLIRK